MKRLFIATFLEEAEREKLADFQLKNKDLVERNLGLVLRSPQARNLHLTWKFLGNVEDETIPYIQECLDEALQMFQSSAQALKLEFKSLELWPSKRNPRVCVAIPARKPEKVMALSKTISDSLKQFESSKSKSFRPHITVYRVKKQMQKSEPEDEYELQSNWKAIKLDINEIDLVESDLSTGKPEYEVISSYKLNRS